MNRFQQLVCAAALGALFASNPVQADPPGPGKGSAKAERKQDKEARKDARAENKDERREARAERKDERKDRRDERKDARDERKDARKDARDERREARDELKGERRRDGDDDDDRGRGDDRGLKLGHMKHGMHFKPSPKFIEAMQKRHESRKDRRDERRQKYEKKWGEFAHGKPAMNEFRLHGWRMAKLRRIRMLAEEMGKDKLVEKVDDLIEKEEARHEKALEKLKEGGGKEAKEAKGDAKGPKPEKLGKPASKPKPPTPQPAKAAKEGD